MIEKSYIIFSRSFAKEPRTYEALMYCTLSVTTLNISNIYGDSLMNGVTLQKEWFYSILEALIPVSYFVTIIF